MAFIITILLTHAQVLSLADQSKSNFGTYDFCETDLGGLDIGTENETICIIEVKL